MIDFSGLRVKLLHPKACLPKRIMNSAGYDLYTTDVRHIPAGEREVIPLGIATEMPYGYFARVLDRSGLAARDGLTGLGGVIDNDYRGEWKVILHNTSDKDIWLAPGDRVAQAVFIKYAVLTVNEVDEIQDSVRGEGGFGSTGR